jgi:hypothetical protein
MKYPGVQRLSDRKTGRFIFTLEIHAMYLRTNVFSVLFLFTSVLCASLSWPATTRAEFTENFDAVVAPALPSGWTTASFGFTWITTTDNPDSPPNCATASTLGQVSEGYLDSPSITVGSTTHLLRFRHRFQLEAAANEDQDPTIGYDGGVLEIAIGGADYQDILTAGGQFLAGEYTRTISTQFGSLISGRQAWSGDSGGYVATSIRLPASAINSTIRLRFRLSSDANNGGGVWAIDSIDVVDECVSQDTEPPVAVCREHFTVRTQCESGVYGLGDVMGAATITDNCVGALTLTQDPPIGTALRPGVSQVTVTATDAAGNVGQCTSTVEVVDYFYPATCGVCCGAGIVEGLLVTFSSLAGRKLSRRRRRAAAR